MRGALRSHLVAGLLCSTAAAAAVWAQEAARHGASSAAAHGAALGLFVTLAAPLGLWLGAVMWALAQLWAPTELQRAMGHALRIQPREVETRRVATTLAVLVGFVAWGAASFVAVRTLVARLVRPELEAAAVSLALLALAVVCAVSANVLRRLLMRLLAWRSRLLDNQLGAVSMPTLVALAICGAAGAGLALRATLADLLYRMPPDPLWATATAAAGTAVALLALGWQWGHALSARLARAAWAVPLTMVLLVGGAWSWHTGLRNAVVREALLDTHPAAGALLLAALAAGQAEEDLAEEDLASGDDDGNGASSEAALGPADALAALAPEGTQRNVVLLSVDTLRADALGAWGNRRGLTPNLDKLAARSVRFSRAYSSGPCSSSSFMGMLSAQLPSRLRGLTRDGDVFTLPPRVTTLPQRFARAGYRTHALMPVVGNYLKGMERGFDVFDTTFRYADKQANAALASLRRLSADKRPFLLWVHFVDPHYPYDAHAEFSSLGASPRDRYEAEVAFTDKQLRAVLEALSRPELARNTVVALFADHGEAFGEHGTRLHGNSLHDEEIHVPLLLNVPGVAPARVQTPVSLLDLGPTLMDLAGVAGGGRGTTGRSVAALLQPGMPKVRRTVVAEGCKPGTMMALINERKLFYRKRSGLFYLYDLQSDPDERRNLYAAAPDREELQASVRAQMAVRRR